MPTHSLRRSRCAAKVNGTEATNGQRTRRLSWYEKTGRTTVAVSKECARRADVARTFVLDGSGNALPLGAFAEQAFDAHVRKVMAETGMKLPADCDFKC